MTSLIEFFSTILCSILLILTTHFFINQITHSISEILKVIGYAQGQLYWGDI
jgi:hypothetical protein